MNRAFFDLDGTIIENFSGVELAKILAELQGEGRWREFWEEQRLLRDNKISYDEAIERLSNCYAKCIKNAKTAFVRDGINRLGNRIKVRDHFEDLCAWLKENDFETFVLTASPEEVFLALPDFQFTETFGLKFEQNDHYTGRVLAPMTAEAKKKIIESRSEDSSFSFGVSDSLQDMIAYESLDMKFLLNQTNSKIENCQFLRVCSFLEIKRIVKDHLRI